VKALGAENFSIAATRAMVMPGSARLGQKLTCNLKAHRMGELPISSPLRLQAPAQCATMDRE
jgi:hypothetical protein